jgi:hypothetical protein
MIFQTKDVFAVKCIQRSADQPILLFEPYRRKWHAQLRQRHPLRLPPPRIASTMPGAAVSVAVAPRRGNPIARRGTWQRLLALGDGRVGSVREHAIHAVAEHRRVQVSVSEQLLTPVFRNIDCDRSADPASGGRLERWPEQNAAEGSRESSRTCSLPVER